MAKDKPEPVDIRSVEQHGGITAGTVHIHPQSQQLYAEPLSVLLVGDDNRPNEKWWNLWVHNPNPSPVRDCYAKVQAYRSSSGAAILPPPGFKLLWRSYGGHRRLVANLAADGGEDWLDYAFALYDGPNVFFTPEPSPINAAKPIDPGFPLPPGHYQAVIEVGSETDCVPKTRFLLDVTFGGATDLQVTMTSLPSAPRADE